MRAKRFAALWAAGLLPACVAIASPPRVTPAELAAADALRQAGRVDEAQRAFETILAHAPDDPETNYRVGLWACDRGDWEKALHCESKAVAGDASCARYQYGWGAANGIAAMKAGFLSRLGYAKKCLAAYERAAELDPQNPEYRKALVDFYGQVPGFAGGDMEKAYAQAAVLKKLDAEHGRQALAQLYAGEKKFDLAFREFEEALRENPADYPALYSIGRFAEQTGQRLDQGLAALARCLALPPPDRADMPRHDNVHWRIGLLWEKKGDLAKARAEYEAALKLNSDFDAAKRALAKLTARRT